MDFEAFVVVSIDLSLKNNATTFYGYYCLFNNKCYLIRTVFIG